MAIYIEHTLLSLLSMKDITVLNFDFWLPDLCHNKSIHICIDVCEGFYNTQWNPRKLSLAFLKAPNAVSVYAQSTNGTSIFIGCKIPEVVYNSKYNFKFIDRSPLDFTQSGKLFLKVIPSYLKYDEVES